MLALSTYEQRVVEAVACPRPRCAAPAGAHCLTPGKRERRPHNFRQQAYGRMVSQQDRTERAREHERLHALANVGKAVLDAAGRD